MRSVVRAVRLLVCVLGLTVISVGIHAKGINYDAFYTFGDSLADNGNDFLLTKAVRADPAVPPSESPHRTYFNGRFSNGYVAFEYLWGMISGQAPDSPGGLKPSLAAPILPLGAAVNFAFGGTGTPVLDQTPGGFYAPGLKGQVAIFRAELQGRKPSAHALYAIVTGANDYRNDQYNVPMAIPDVIQNIVDSIQSLYDAGARDVLVLDLPDIGLLPGTSPADAPAESELSREHNLALAAAISSMQSRLPKANLMLAHVDDTRQMLPPSMNLTTPAIDALFAFAGHPPSDFPFPMSACLFVSPPACLDVPTSPMAPVVFNANLNFLFWDIVHPTTQAHQILAQHLYNIIVNSQ